MAVVEFFASEGHFVDHLAPIYRATPEWARGRFFVGPDARARAEAHELPAHLVDSARLPGPPLPVVVAAIGDYRKTDDRPRVLAEHGAGQTYGTRHPSYAGGIGRDAALLFIVPNRHAARRNQARYPRIPCAVVGSPRLDDLATIPAPVGVPTAVVSFHWRCRVAPETDTALDHYAPALAGARRELAEQGIRLLGHAHPRILDEAGPIFEAAGMDVLPTFEDVVARAHVYAVDNSSTLFEFAALDRPVVVLNQPSYRRHVEHGLRFWTAAGVGDQVDRPEDLAGALARAFVEGHGARSREKALARVYPVRDGSSASRAARAVLGVTAPGRCLVCGSGGATCSHGGATTVVAVDQRMKERSKMGGPLKTYPNPNGRGMIRLREEEAERLGLTGGASGPVPEAVAPSMPADPNRPEGALAAGGPTARARAAAAPSEEKTEGDAEQKKRNAPTTRRRRAAGPKAG